MLVALGDPARGIAVLPWLALALVALTDWTLSRPRGLGAQLTVAPELFVGEDVPLTLSVTGVPQGAEARLDWPDGLRGPGVVSVTGADTQITAQAARRGLWPLDRLWLCWPSRLGLFQVVPQLPLDIELRVVPNIRLVQSGEISVTVQSALHGVKENRMVGDGSEFHQLRDFTPGMDVKTIDWKRSAKRRSLVAKELRAERNHHVIIALDNGYLMGQQVAGLPRIDHAVTAGLALAWAAAVGGDRVGYFAYDVQPRLFLKPEPGRAAFAAIRARTAELDYVGRETNHTLALTELSARTPKRSLIVIFTEFVDTTSAELLVENIRLLSKRHLVVFVALRDAGVDALVDQAPQDLDGVAAVVAAHQVASERRLVFEQLARIGVTVIDARPGQVTAQLIATYLDIKARDLL